MNTKFNSNSISLH